MHHLAHMLPDTDVVLSSGWHVYYQRATHEAFPLKTGMGDTCTSCCMTAQAYDQPK